LLIVLPETHEARKQISVLRRECRLSYRDISIAAGVSIRAIRNCERYNVLVAEARVRIDGLYDICKLISTLKPQNRIRIWLRTPQQLFEGKSALKFIQEGKASEIKRIIYGMITRRANR